MRYTFFWHLPMSLARGNAEPAHEPRRRVQVSQAEAAAGEPHRLVELMEELVAVVAPVADGGTHHDVVHHAADPLAEVDAATAAAGMVAMATTLIGDGAEEARHLLLPDGPEREHAVRVEELEHAHSLRRSRQLAVVVGGRRGCPCRRS